MMRKSKRSDIMMSGFSGNCLADLAPDFVSVHKPGGTRDRFECLPAHDRPDVNASSGCTIDAWLSGWGVG
jgi:hypothetical protein